MIIIETEFYQQMKPRLQHTVLDIVFKTFYGTFMHAFHNCDKNFRREVFRNCIFTVRQPKDTHMHHHGCCSERDWYENDDNDVLLPAGQKSEYIYFINSGSVHIMDKTAKLLYGTISEGAYFGDISILNDEPPQYSYVFNTYQDKAL